MRAPYRATPCGRYGVFTPLEAPSKTPVSLYGAADEGRARTGRAIISGGLSAAGLTVAPVWPKQIGEAVAVGVLDCLVQHAHEQWLLKGRAGPIDNPDAHRERGFRFVVEHGRGFQE